MTKDEEIDKLKQELADIKQEYQQFVYIVSHDMSAPLRHIDYFTNRLFNKNTDELSEQAHEDKKIIEHAVSKAKSILATLLNYSRLATKNSDAETLQLTDIAEQALSRLEPKIAATNAKITVKPLPQVIGTEASMVDLFVEVINNALTYIDKSLSPIIDIEASHKDGRNFITFSDNGIGFEEKHFEHIFTLFKRVVPDKDYEGAGVGLAFARRIAKLHHGDLVVKKSSPQGSQFELSLPAQ